jgi:glycosyltransferase involved in cell wall biosynthesis
LSDPPLLTAAIICYNRPKLVRDAIESVLAQEFDDYELVIVDDASTDNSADVIREYADRATVVIREKNGGEMAARNTALEASRGEYICYLDSDDVWFPWSLSTFADAIARNGKPTMVAGPMLSFSDESELSTVRREPYAQSTCSCYFASRHYVGVASAAIRRDALVNAGGFTDLRFNGMDSDLMFRIGDLPGFVQVESPVSFAYRQLENITGNIPMAYGGTRHVIEMEAAGRYPGGDALRADRLRHVTRRTRNATFLFLRRGEARKALAIYWQTLGWNLRMRRWGYLAAVPLMAVFPPLRKLYRTTR